MRISTRLHTGPEGAGEARKALDALARESSHEVLSTVQLLVSELVANGPRHVDEPEQAVLLEIETSRTSIHTSVIQLGTGRAIRATADEADRAGWDVILLGELSSRWGILEGSSEGVWFEIDRWSKSTLGRRT